MSNVECQRFFAFSKRVPKDVKRFCGICRQHGKLEETRGHICEFKDCECPKCNLVRSRRLVMSQQIRLRRAQDKRFQRTTEPEEADVVPILTAGGGGGGGGPEDTNEAGFTKQQLMDAKNMCYFCQKCKNHGILVWKKQHKRQCPFTNCTCDFCELIETRRRLDQHIKRRKSEPQGGSSQQSGCSPSSTEDGVDEDGSPVPRKKSTSSLPAHIEAAMGAGTSSSSFAADAFGPFGHFRYSPPGQQQQQPAIPIGIAGARIAEAEEPLDALAAQIQRIQQQSPVVEEGQQQLLQPTQSPSSATGSVASSSPSAFGFGLLEQQQQLLSQLLLSSLSPPSATAATAADSVGAALLPTAVPVAASDALFTLSPSLEPMWSSPSHSPMLAAVAAAQLQQQQKTGGGGQQQPIGNDADFLGQLLMSVASGQQQQQMTASPAGGLLLPKLQAMELGEQQQQKDLLIQLIAQLLQEQQQNEAAAVAIVQQHQQAEKALLDALLGSSAGLNGPSLEQLALQSAALDPATLAAASLLTQQQQQSLQLLLKTANQQQNDEDNNNNGAVSPSTTATSSSSGPHTSAFTAFRSGGLGLP